MYGYWVFWAELALIIMTSTSFLVLGYLLCRRHRWASYTAVTVGAVCLSYRVLTSTFPDRFYVDLPYLVLAGVIAPAGFLLLAGALNLTMSQSRQRVLIGVFSVVLTYYVFCDAAYLVVNGPDIAKLRGKWEGGALIQSRGFTCGPAAAAALLHAWGIPKTDLTEGRLAYAARTSYRGTELPRLASVIRYYGRRRPLRVEILSTSLDELRTFNRPAILLVVKKGRRRHVVTLLKMTNGRLLIADPGTGSREFRVDDFHRQFEWHGRAVVAWRDSSVPPFGPPDPTLHP